MRVRRIFLVCSTAAACILFSGTPSSGGQIDWSPSKKEAIDVRLVALAAAYPRSSYFANDEVFVAEQELAKDETRFIKLVYDFLPYQAPLSSYGLDYSLVHRVNAVRDTSCDENLWQMRSWLGQRRQAEPPSTPNWKYALECPIADLDHRQARLRCYRTTSDDFERTVRQPANESPY
jgi:hypothetical protein